MKNHYKLNITTDGALKISPKEFCLNNTNRADVYIPNLGGIWTFGKQEIFNEEWVNYVAKTIPYIEITGALVFWRQQFYQHPAAHIDVAPKNSPSRRDIEYEDNGFHATNSSNSMNLNDFYPVVSAYNFVLDPTDDSAMTWYEPKPTAQVELKKFSNAVHYDEVPIDQLIEVDRTQISAAHLTMVRTNRLHNVEMGSKERWSISARAIMGWESWEQAVKTLEPWLLP